MGEFLSPEALRLFLAFAVPGIVTVYFRCQFLTGRMPPFSEGVASYITISLLYYAFFVGLFPEFWNSDLTNQISRGWWFVFVFIIPAIIGSALGLNARHGWTSKIFSKARANTVHPIECSWDWKFSNCPESWVRVRLKDGTEWAGLLGVHSFLSSNPEERDLFLERVYWVDDDNSWSEKASSVWIGHNEIQSIEMWPK